MTTEINSDCSAFNIDSPLIDAYQDDAGYTLTLYVAPTCSESETEFVITEAFLNGQDNIILTPDELSVDEFAAGIYLFRLVKVEDNGSTTTEKSCEYVGCPIECDVLKYISSNFDSNLYQLHHLLQYTSDCTDCNCEGMCEIFDYIQTVLNDFDGCECA